MGKLYLFRVQKYCFNHYEVMRRPFVAEKIERWSSRYRLGYQLVEAYWMKKD